MGADGYRVYRYQGLFFSSYTRYNSYPDSLGVKLAREIPPETTQFEAYVASKKAEPQQLLDSESAKDTEGSEGSESGAFTIYDGVGEFAGYIFRLEISETPPTDGLYNYEIDLDNYIFYFEGKPMFDLRNMLYGDEFLSNIYPSELPEKHRYKIPLPPPVDSSILDAYKNFGAHCAETHTVLGVRSQMGRIENTRMKIMELCVLASTYLLDNSYGLGVNAILSDYVSARIIRRCHNICDLFSGPLIFDNDINCLDWELRKRDYLTPPAYDVVSFYWLDEESFCMLAVPRIDTEDTLQAAIVKLSRKVSGYFEDKECNTSTFYGAILSIYDVCVVRFVVVEHNGERKYQVQRHTPSLRFLPQSQPSKLYTPGIEALSRLGHIIYKDFLQQKLITERKKQHEFWSKSRLIPSEICLHIAQYLPYKIVTSLASVSLQWASVAVEVLQQPYFIIRDERWQLGRPLPRVLTCYWFRVFPTARENLSPEGYVDPLAFQALDNSGRNVTIYLTTDVFSEWDRLEDTINLGDGLDLFKNWEKYQCRIKVCLRRRKDRSS
ncbi:hypothetical protein DFJ43DRAFT_1153032 [Lentinula guzmanii]|uniref:F-box domain-containing protein n=1 Tax=Lentinula guzmanii TaxID=2804957 RepID=A0AA38JQM2_9AGAR|nr:hypothetical protein DFJ43DRAFT_1153032 [Lentinula guzmanii]